MNKITKQAVWAALGVFVVLVGIYGLGYSGFPVSDDEQLFAAAAQSIASGKGSTVPQLYGNDRLLGEYIPSGSLHIYLGAAVLSY